MPLGFEFTRGADSAAIQHAVAPVIERLHAAGMEVSPNPAPSPPDNPPPQCPTLCTPACPPHLRLTACHVQVLTVAADGTNANVNAMLQLQQDFGCQPTVDFDHTTKNLRNPLLRAERVCFRGVWFGVDTLKELRESPHAEVKKRFQHPPTDSLWVPWLIG